MKNLFLLLTVPVILAACATPRISPSVVTCSGTTNGPADARVSFRSGTTFMVKMKLKSNAQQNSEFRIRLAPTLFSGSKDVVVKTKAVSGAYPAGSGLAGSPPINWLNGSGSYNSLAKNKLVLCVPNNLPVGTWFKFDVIVDGIGTIDPRLDVTL